MKKKNQIITVIFLVALLCGLGSLVLSHTRTFSDNENRVLRQYPALSLDAVRSGKWMKDFESFVEDQFGAREFWISLKAKTELLMQKKENNDVVFGKEGTLLAKTSETVNSNNVTELNRFTENNPDLDITCMLVPSSITVNEDFISKPYPKSREPELLSQLQQPHCHWIDVYSVLYGKDNVYFKTDHHWTADGALYAYMAWRDEKGLEEKSMEYYTCEMLTDDFKGTIWSKAGAFWMDGEPLWYYFNPDVTVVCEDESGNIREGYIDRSYLDTKDKYGAFLSSNHAYLHIETNVKNGRKLLVVKDSYANILIPLLCEEYETIEVLDLRYNKTKVSEYAREHGISEVLIVYQLDTFVQEPSVGFLR